ncbi:MAG: T9SS type A sorting domain-containing protein [Ferruginibacter sp.]
MHPDNTINISVINNGGAFKINSPNTSVVWEGGSIKNVTWSVSGTTQSPINTEFVKILLSTDGGYTFPNILLESTPNSGNADVTLPNIQTSQARIKVEAVGNIYFDICDNNFTINAATSLTTIATGSVTPLIYCAGNTVSIPFTIDKNANSGNTFTAQLSNSNGSFTSPLTIGTLTSISQGIINATIPSQITPGSGYRIRVVSSNPSIIGSNNGANITINNLPAASVISANGATTICQGSSVIIAGNNSGGTWSNGGSTSGSIIVNTSGDYFVTNTNSCGSNTSNHIYVTVNPLPIVSAGPYANVQTSTPAFSLAGSPAGGTFSGTGVSNNVFNPATAGVGNFQITYTYTNGNGCTNFNSTQINVEEGECIFSVGSIEGSINVCDFMDPQGGNATYTIEASGASSFTWTVPSNSVIVSGQGTNTIILDFSPSFVSGTIYVRITNACGGNPVKKYLNINSTIPNTPGLISGPTNPCLFLQGGVATYSIEKVLNASFYNWVVPAGANIISHPNGIGENDTIINVTYNSAFVSGSAISVKSGSYCGVSSSERSLIIKSPSISVPSKIFGQSDVCYAAGNSTLVKFSIKPVTNAISYNWSLSGNATIAQHPGGEGSPNDTIIYILIGSDFTTGSVRVSASNGCIISSERVLNLFIKAPNSPVKIFGNPNLVTGVSDAPILEVCDAVITGSYLVYSINKVKVATDESGFASSYNWEISDNVNAQITHPNGSGINDTIIRVYFGSNFTSATLGVSAERACKSSNARSISLYKKAPLPPGPISGQSQVCKEDIKSYSVEANSSTTYTWTTPSGIIILSGQGTPTIELQFTYQFTGGTLRVSASSACGNSSPVSLKLILCTAPAKPDLITKVNEEKTPDLLIYPNPSSGIFNLEFKNVKDNSKSNISITTIGGKLVYYSTEFLLEDKLRLNLRSKLLPGIYILKTMINGRFINKKLVIQ